MRFRLEMDDNTIQPNSLLEEPSGYNYYFAAGNEGAKLKFAVLNHVEATTAKMLFCPASSGRCMDEVTCAEACTILGSLEPIEQETCCYAMVNLLMTERKNLLALDKIITKIIFVAYDEGIIPLLLACQLLVTSVDFRMTIPLNPEKIRFVRERMHQLDYKNMRDLLKLLLVEKLDKMSCILTEHQHKQLVPIEELMIDLIDRKENFCPALFFITEISRIQSNSPVHFLPRVSLKIREMVASFRPLAEIGSMIGRSWMYPITTQPSFSWVFNTWSTWKLQEQNYRLYFKTHLPYSNENMAPQTYLQYILLKQPRGQENLIHMLKSSSSHNAGSAPRLQCSEVVQILILEAMCAMEDSDTSVLMSTNQYNWLHLCHLMTHALSIGCCSLQQLLPMLQIQLKNCHYHKAKGELMWILLQFIATAKSKSAGSLAANYAKNQLDPKNRDLVLDIFNVLYPDEMVWAGSSRDCLNMVRFFAPASLWINLSYCPGSSSNVPPQKVQQHIEFLKTQLESGMVLENGVLAVIANAYSNNSDIFDTHVSRAILKMLGAITDSPPSFSNVQQWTLPHARKADGCLAALDLALLDSFTFHAKKMLYTNLTAYLQSHTQNGSLPSPALIETICRILLTTEMGDNGKLFLTFFTQVCKETQNLELISICADMLNYRLQNMQLNAQYRVHFMLCAFEVMCNLSTSPSSQHRAVYAKMEQVIMRQMMIASPLDLAYIAYIFANNRNSPVSVNIFVPPESFGRVDYRQSGLHACPEISRMFLLNLLRAHKVLASSSLYIVSEIAFDYVTPVRQYYKWSSSAAKWFPSVLQNVFEIESPPNHMMIQNYQITSDEECRKFMSNEHDKHFLPNYQSVTLLISVFKCMHDFSYFPLHAYKVLATLSAKDLIIITNAFVDYIIWRSQNLDSQDSDQYEKMISMVNEMIFVKNCIPIERFFLSLVLHPNDDSSIEFALLLLSSLIKQYNHFSQRIYNYCAFAPLHSNSVHSKSEDFFTKLTDYYKKYPEPTYLELIKLNMSSEKFTETEKHLPIYYDNMPERILPIVDVLLQRSLEIAVNPQILTTFLTTFAPLYKFHPQPLTFLYKTMYSLDSLGTFSHTPVARQFVMEIVQKIDDDRNPKYIVLSQEFVLNDHKTPVVKFCQALVDRIIAASTYLHQPPSFVVRDWRFAEYPPAAQALTGAWIELMASPHSAKEITDGIVQLAMRRPINRPYDTINAIGLLLTGLPNSFQSVFFNQITDSFDWPQVVNGEPSMLFELFSQEVYLYSESRILSMLALIHSFCQHAGNNSLSVLPDLIADRLAPKVQNETQLMYFLRILVPYLQRISDKEKQRHMNEYLKLIISIYNVLGTLVEKIGQLKYEDTVCDLLYQFKYMFVGYSLKSETEQAIEKFPESMREKLKFLLTHSSSAESFQQQQQQQIVVGHGQHTAQPQLVPFAAAGAIPSNHPLFSYGSVASQIQQYQQAGVGVSSSGTQLPMVAQTTAVDVASTNAANSLTPHGILQNSQQHAAMMGIGCLGGLPQPGSSSSSSNTSSNINFGGQLIDGGSGGGLQNFNLNQASMPRFPPSSINQHSSQGIGLNNSGSSGLPPPPPYSQHPMLDPNISAAGMGSGTFSTMGMNSTVNTSNSVSSTAANGSNTVMMSGAVSSGIGGGNAVGLMGAGVSTFPGSSMALGFPGTNVDPSNFQGTSDPQMMNMSGMPMSSQFQQQFFHQQMHNQGIMSRVNITTSSSTSGNMIPGAMSGNSLLSQSHVGFGQPGVNFPSSGSQMFMPTHQHIQPSGDSNLSHMGGMHPHSLHANNITPQDAAAFQAQMAARQQMGRFPPPGHIM